MMIPSLSPLHAPLGLEISDEVQAVRADIEVPAKERAIYAMGGRGFRADSRMEQSQPESKNDSHDRVQVQVRLEAPHSRKFRVADELLKVRLSRSIESSIEPIGHLLEALSRLNEPDGLERLDHVPSLLDFFPDELQSIPEAPLKSSMHDDGFADLGSDSYYRGKKNENVEAASMEPVVEPVAAVQDAPAQAAPVTLVRTTADGVSIAHSQCAYDLSGSMPWANYSTDGFSPLNPQDIRYHRVHLCSPNIDRPLSVWSVMAPKPAVHLDIPRDGTCPFRNSAHLSLRDAGQFILTESVEQFPLLMHFHGMSASVLRYWRPRHGAAAPDAEQLEALGRVGQLVKLDSEFLPRAYGGGTIKVDSTACVLESSLLRAPIFPHKMDSSDFLLVRSRAAQKSGSAQFHCVLRMIDTVFCLGQAEPLYRVDVPVIPRLHQVLSARVAVECRRFWLRAKQHPNMEYVSRVFIGERRSLLTRYFADALRDITQRPSQPLAGMVTPEEACVVNAMKEGIRRLAERGIERICAISPMRIRNYVRDIEVFERSMPTASRTPRVSHCCVQLENEMRSSPWNLANDYWDVMTAKRGAMFQFSPLGDPSGGRGEGLSFRKILKVDGASAASALGSIAGAKPAGPEMEDLRSRSKKELVEELQKLNVPDRVWRSMSRWQLMRQLALLLGIEDETEERLAPWKRKALHSERIYEAWKKQAKALSDPTPPPVTHDELRRAGATALSSGVTTPDSGSEDEGSANGEKGLEEMMLDELMGETAQAEPSGVLAIADENQRELELFRRDLRGDVIESQPDEVEEEIVDSGKSRITRLQIVSTGRTKSTGNPWSKVTYVYGARNIALYRKWKELEEEGFPVAASPAPTEAPAAEPVAPDWQAKVEMSLKVHRRFQRIIRQAAEAGRPILDCKRCSACHLFGHDQTYEGCPMMLRDLDVGPAAIAGAKKRKNLELSPVYD